MYAILLLSLLLLMPTIIYAQSVDLECKLDLSEDKTCKKEYDDVPVSTTIAVIGTVIAAGGLFYTGYAQRVETKSKYVELINDFDDQISQKEKSPVRTNDYAVFAAEYLNIHEKIAHLVIKKIIPKEIAKYFVSSFEACRGILADPLYSKYADDLTYLVKWCKVNNVKVGPKP